MTPVTAVWITVLTHPYHVALIALALGAAARDGARVMNARWKAQQRARRIERSPLNAI